MRATSVVAVALIVTSTGFASLDVHALGGGTYTIANGQVINTDIVADVIVLPSGSTAYWGNSIKLDATTKIEIAGTLRDWADDGIARHITLESDRDIVIGGHVLGAPGTSGTNVTSNDSATGANADPGSNVTIRWGLLGSFTLGAQGSVRAGDGGHGASVYVRPDAGSPPTLSANAGHGGAAGVLKFDGVLSNVYGNVILARNGNGGIALIKPSELVAPAGQWSASGGSGNAPAAKCVGDPCPTTQESDGGGAGGDACVLPWIRTDTTASNSGLRCEIPNPYDIVYSSPLDGSPGSNCGGTSAVGGDGSSGGGYGTGGAGGDGYAANYCNPTDGGHGDDGHPAACDGRNGGRGGQGGAAFAKGGKGGEGGWRGGAGGEAIAYSSQGARGGAGGDAYSPCLYGYAVAGNGGNGGNGAAAEARGGAGGDSNCHPGPGGSSDGYAPAGGAGGAGGAPDGMRGAAGSPGGLTLVNGAPGSYVASCWWW